MQEAFNGLACGIHGRTIESEGRVTVSDQGLLDVAMGGEPLCVDRAQLVGWRRGKFGLWPTVVVQLRLDRELELAAVDAWGLGEAVSRLLSS